MSTDAAITHLTPPSVEDILALIGRRRVVKWRLAAVLGRSPNRLSAILNGRAPLPPELAVTIARTLVEAD
jgi:plasmid maintenance system antidote protein VapI